MKTKRIIEITVETDEVFVIRRPTGSFQAQCPQCAAEVQVVGPEEAAAMVGANLQTGRACVRNQEADCNRALGESKELN